MRMKVQLRFTDAEREQVDTFARAVGLSVDKFCKQAVFYAINDAYRRAEEAEQNVHNPLNTTSPDAEGNTGDTGNSGSIDSSALSDQTNETPAP